MRNLWNRGRRLWLTGALAVVLALCSGLAPEAARAQEQSFADWLDGVKREARAAQISESTIETALAGIAPIPRVIELDRRQPEFTQTFWAYLEKRVTAGRVARGRRMLAQHRGLLERVQARYGVQPRFLVAFWALESNFGDHTGGFSVIGALATLAYDERRSAFFRSQLMDALKIVDQGHITPASMSGSWAGAMGQLQFIPSTFVNYAVDYDGDKRRDIWNSLPDIFASAANYLSRIGWRGDETWGREVRLPPDFDWGLIGLGKRRALEEWQRLGLRRIDGRDLPRADLEAAVMLPAGHKGPAFLVYGNFNAILKWNRSLLYAVAVGHLADRLVGRSPLRTERPVKERPMSRAQIEEMQSLLGSLGFDAGKPDGIVGSQTRRALGNFQRQAGLVPDGYPSQDVLENLRQLAGQQTSAN